MKEKMEKKEIICPKCKNDKIEDFVCVRLFDARELHNLCKNQNGVIKLEFDPYCFDQELVEERIACTKCLHEFNYELEIMEWDELKQEEPKAS